VPRDCTDGLYCLDSTLNCLQMCKSICKRLKSLRLDLECLRFHLEEGNLENDEFYTNLVSRRMKILERQIGWVSQLSCKSSAREDVITLTKSALKI
jgi:hypothetical protein